MSRAFLVSILLIVASGCALEERTYEVSVENKLDKPITLWLVKQDGPVEPGWESPELLGLGNPANDDKLPDVVVPPGKTAVCGPILGKFDKGRGRAYLRVYSGAPTLTEMLAINRRSHNRLDVQLEPGMPNRYTIDDQYGVMNLTKTAAASQPGN